MVFRVCTNSLQIFSKLAFLFGFRFQLFTFFTSSSLTRCKVKEEEEARNVNNWNEQFNKLEETHFKEQYSNEIGDLLKYVENTTTNGNC